MFKAQKQGIIADNPFIINKLSWSWKYNKEVRLYLKIQSKHKKWLQ